jgi:acyl-coenzyme A thioesterase PaaI-like protein
MSERRRLADEVRRVIESLQLTDLTDDARDLADRIRSIADDLAAGARRDSWHADPSVGLDVVFTPNEDRRWMHDSYSPMLGGLNPVAPPLTIEVVESEDGPRLRGEVTLSATYEGAPRTVHGGVVSALMDEMLGNAQRVARVAGYTGTITTRFRAPTPTYTPLVLEAWVDRVEGRKIFMAGALHADGTLCAEAEGIFISPLKEPVSGA